MDGHEFTTMVASYLDDSYYDFIVELEKNDILNDTMVIFFSDHGQHMTPFNEEF